MHYPNNHVFSQMTDFIMAFIAMFSFPLNYFLIYIIAIKYIFSSIQLDLNVGRNFQKLCFFLWMLAFLDDKVKCCMNLGWLYSFLNPTLGSNVIAAILNIYYTFKNTIFTYALIMIILWITWDIYFI